MVYKTKIVVPAESITILPILLNKYEWLNCLEDKDGEPLYGRIGTDLLGTVENEWSEQSSEPRSNSSRSGHLHPPPTTSGTTGTRSLNCQPFTKYVGLLPYSSSELKVSGYFKL